MSDNLDHGRHRDATRPRKRRKDESVDRQEGQTASLQPQQAHLDELLDTALKDSFPASDPPAIAVDE